MFIYILASLVLYLLGYGRLNPLMTYIGIGIILILYFLNKGKDHNHNLLIMESISNKSPQRGINPVTKLLAVITMILIVVGFRSVVISLIVFIASIFHFVVINKISFDYYKEFMHAPLIFILISILGIIITISKNALGYMDISVFGFFISITRNSQEKGIQLLLMGLSSVSVLINFAASTPLGDVIYALKKLKTPWIVIELMYLLYRYIFTLFHVLNLLQISASSRLGFYGIKKTYKTSMVLASRLFNKSFIMARNSYDAMESRMYSGRLRFIEKEKSSSQGIMYFAFIIFLIFIIVWEKII